MTLRVSAKLGRKIHEVPSEVLAADGDPFADWSAHLFVAGRVQYIIVTNTASLYSAVMYGKGVTDGASLIRRTSALIGETMKADGLGAEFERLVVPSLGVVSFSKALNRSVTGSMNDLIHGAKMHLIDDGMVPSQLAEMLNETPMQAIGMEVPIDVIRKMAR